MAAALQVGSRAMVRLWGLPRAVRMARWISERSQRGRNLATVGWALAVSAPRIGGTCLTQAVAALALAGSASRQARLVIGVRPAPGALEFHAWTEIAGVTFPPTADAASFALVTVWS